MKQGKYLQFLGIGLLVGGFGEAINHLFIMGTPNGFIFALGFYTLTLTVAYQSFRRFVLGHGRFRWWFYSVGWGLGFGLIINEWILIGHHPSNPTSSSIMSQFSMIAFHSMLYMVPALSQLPHPKVKPFLKRFGLVSLSYGMIIVFILFQQESPEAILGWGVLLTYFLGYSPLFLWLLFWIEKQKPYTIEPE